MTITTESLTAQEKQWLEAVLNKVVRHKDVLISQINSAEIERDVFPEKYFIYFKHKSNLIKLPKFETKVPINMLVQHQVTDKEAQGIVYHEARLWIPFDLKKPVGESQVLPTQFLLYIEEGCISELEIFNWSLSPLNEETLLLGRKDYAIDPILIDGGQSEAPAGLGQGGQWDGLREP